jgi:hypothetical protein
LFDEGEIGNKEAIMDYGKVLSRAWQITWRWKALWVFGFLVSLSNRWPQLSNRANWIERGGGDYIPPEVGVLLVSLACVAVLVGIAFGVLSVISRGALIGGVRQAEEEDSTDLKRAWRVGVSRFWTLFGVSVLTALPLIVMWLVVVAAFVGPILADVGFSGEGEPGVGVALALLCGAPLCCSAILVTIVLSQIRTYADCAAVLEGLGWIDAFRRGWQVLRENLGHTVVYWLIFFVIGLAFIIVVGGGLMALYIPFIAVVRTGPGVWMLGPVFCGGLLAAAIGAAIGAVVQTFVSATWTLAYREMAGLGARPTEMEAVAG